MKRLLLDLGNSRLKAAWQDSENLQILPIQEVDQIGLAIPAQPDQIWLSSVADQAQTEGLVDQLSDLVTKIHQVKVPVYQHYLPTKYAPEQLGVDRWLAMLACYHESPGPCLVVDCGTAVTLDWVNSMGEHQGGYILPGLQMMQQALLQGTAIHWVKPDDPIQTVARDSASAIALGARHALVALIEKMLDQAEPQTQLFLGGGDAGEIAISMASSHKKIQHMVLKGLSCLADLEAE